MNYILTLLLLFPLMALAQIRGEITDTQGTPIRGATITLKGSSQGTTSNENGKYEIKTSKTDTYTLTVYNLGYQTISKTVAIDTFPYTLDFALEPTIEVIEEVIIGNRGNPADRIIREAIAHKKINSQKYDRYQVDFYSKGVLKVIDLPKKIMGRDLDSDEELMDELMLDSTRSGIVYLSETMSEVFFERPYNFKETIKASKVSGNDRGYSFNTAMGANFDFYSNYVPILGQVISPLADRAFTYYRYSLEQSFESGDHLIFKINVEPIRISEPVAYGSIYIIDDTWEVYAVDLSVKGTSVNEPLIDSVRIQQQYIYQASERTWLKQSQHIHYGMSILGVRLGGFFVQVFNNYQFRQAFEKGTFGRTLVKVEAESNTMSDDFWANNRPFVLQAEEKTNYMCKDSLQQVRNSPAYLDSLDRVRNKFKPGQIITGYTYRSSRQKYEIGYDLLNNINKFSFNAVQGFTMAANLHASKRSQNDLGRTAFSTDISYGFSDRKFRFSSALSHRFSTKEYRQLTLSGGSDVEQFNNSKPISPFVNMIASLFFKENFIKLYQRDYTRLAYSDVLFPGLSASIGIEYNRRSPLSIHTDYSFLQRDIPYESNHPLDPTDYDTAPFENHRIAKWNLNLVINPGQRIIDRPDGLLYVNKRHVPTLRLGYEQGFASSHSFQLLTATIRQNVSLNNKGNLQLHLKGGRFFNGDNMAFMDYKHFNGNQTHIGSSAGYMDRFMLLPYYANSTNDSYFETHAEHNFNGFILNKIPWLNKLGFNEIIGHHHFSVPGRPSYQEFTVGLDKVGWGKFRPFRIDYVKSFQDGIVNDGFVLGLKFLRF